MKSRHQLRVEKFRRLAGQKTPTMPIEPNEESAIFGAKLVLSEALELCRDLGLRVTVGDTEGVAMIISDSLSNIEFEKVSEPDLVGVADNVADVHVVATQVLSMCGIGDEEIQYEVDEANLRKFGPGGYRSDGTDGNPKGKWVKPKDFIGPESAIRRILLAQGWRPPVPETLPGRDFPSVAQPEQRQGGGPWFVDGEKPPLHSTGSAEAATAAAPQPTACATHPNGSEESAPQTSAGYTVGDVHSDGDSSCGGGE